jgi:hypothetical protein
MAVATATVGTGESVGDKLSRVASATGAAIKGMRPSTAHMGGLVLNSVLAIIFIWLVVWTRGNK